MAFLKQENPRTTTGFLGVLELEDVYDAQIR